MQLTRVIYELMLKLGSSRLEMCFSLQPEFFGEGAIFCAGTRCYYKSGAIGNTDSDLLHKSMKQVSEEAVRHFYQ
jgi:hypothetical protein